MIPPINPPPLLSEVRVVRCTLTKWDVYKCRMYMLLHHKTLLAMSIILSCVIPGLSINDPAIANHSIGVRIVTFVFAAAFTFIVMLALNAILQLILLSVQKNRGVVGDHEFEIRDDGLVERTAFNESLYKWSGFHKVAGTKTGLIIYVTENNLHYIPFNSFATPEQATNFRAELMRRSQAARP